MQADAAQARLADRRTNGGGKAGRELAGALEMLPADVDTDGDGAPDQAELALCGNPSGEELGEGPGYGCNASLSTATARKSWLSGAAIGVLLFACIRRSRALT